jgi:hypothetical protein
VLYYLTLRRLGKLATFKDVRRTLLDVANIYFATDATGIQRKLDFLAGAYDAVGITA